MSDRQREPLGKFAPDNINDHILHVIFELAGTHIPQNSLQKIMRSGDQIINFVNSIRILIDNHNHKVPFTKLASAVSDGDTISRISLFRNEEEWVKKYLENNSETDQIILCYTNKRVDFLNKKIRKALYKTEKNDFVDGEKIIFNNFYNLNINKFLFYLIYQIIFIGRVLWLSWIDFLSIFFVDFEKLNFVRQVL